MYKEAYRCLKPGGWIEHMDSSGGATSKDNSVAEDSALKQWGKIWEEAGRRIGGPVDIVTANLQEEGMKAAGFVNITKKDYLVSYTKPCHKAPPSLGPKT